MPSRGQSGKTKSRPMSRAAKLAMKGIARVDSESSRTHGWFVRIYFDKTRESHFISDRKVWLESNAKVLKPMLLEQQKALLENKHPRSWESKYEALAAKWDAIWLRYSHDVKVPKREAKNMALDIAQDLYAMRMKDLFKQTHHMKLSGVPMRRLIASRVDNNTGTPGVQRMTITRRKTGRNLPIDDKRVTFSTQEVYRVNWTDKRGNKKLTTFSINAHGEEGAYKKAMATRRRHLKEMFDPVHAD